MADADGDLRDILGDTFSYGDARKAGVSDKRLYRLRDRGDIVALGGGVYRWAEAPPADDDLIEIAERVPQATLCLETALARHGLIDAIPPRSMSPCRAAALGRLSGRQSACTSSTGAPSNSAAACSTSAAVSTWAFTPQNAPSSTSYGCGTARAATSPGTPCAHGWPGPGEAPRS